MCSTSYVLHYLHCFDRLDTSVKTVLQNHRAQILSPNTDDIIRIKVRRRHVYEDGLHHFKRPISAHKHIRVTFLGEPAVDAGGPLREFFHLLLSEIAQNNTLFCGTATARIPRHDMVELSKQTYKCIGSILAASIVHGGPAPNFFSDAVANYIVYGIEHAKASIEDVPCTMMKEKLQKVCTYIVKCLSSGY